LALGSAVLFNTPPNDRSSTDPDDVRQLVDGKLSPATPIWYDRKSTVGWALVDPTVFTIDLGAIHPIRGVALHMGAGHAGVEWPTSIQIQVSDDGERYSHVGNLMELLARRPPATGYASLWLVTDKLQTHGRFVRFVCSPINLGTGEYIMLDEVEIYQGETAWLDRPLAWPEAPEQWRANWEEIQWRDDTATIPRAECPARLLVVDGETERSREEPLQQAALETNGMSFTLLGEAGRRRRMSWTATLPEAISTAKCRHALLTFRAEGVRRTYAPLPIVLLQGVSDTASGNSVTLLEANMVLNDGRSHTLTKILPEGFTLRQLRVTLPTESDAPRLTLERLELLTAPPQIFNTEIATGETVPREGFVAVELGAALDGSLTGWHERALAKYGIAFDGASTLPAGPCEVSGIPFVIASGEKNLVLMPDTPEKNERIEFLGQTMDSRNLGPTSRDDAIRVDVDANVREAYLLLALIAPPLQTRGGLPHTALRLDDIECLTVELTYDRGRSETAFPYSLADQGCYIPVRELGAYAVAVDPTRRLREITLHAHQFRMNFALAGLTLNTSDMALVPQLVDFPVPEHTARHPNPHVRPVTVAVRDRHLTLSNRWYEYSFDLAQGFAIERIVNRANSSANIELAPSSGLRLRVGETVYTGRCFAATITRITATAAKLKLISTRPELPLEILVTITAHDSPELSFVAEMRNTGKEMFAAELCLPALAGVTIGALADTRLFFPQYRTVDTGENIVLRAPYGPEFASQFMDIYSRPAGVGLMVRTDNHEQCMATFTLRKDTEGVAGGVYFSAEFNQLVPGVFRSYPPVSLFAHGGDWHAAFDLYRNWVRSWYKPYKSQDKEYFLNAWNLQCYRLSQTLSRVETRAPSMIAPDGTRHFVNETFEFEKQRLGHVPDLVHFYSWTYNDQKHRYERGVHGTPLAYQQVGGLEFFREIIAAIQEKWQRPLSLYTLIDRFRASALPNQALARELAATAVHQSIDNDDSAALRGAGQVDGIFYPGFGNERWADFFVNDIAKMQRDTGCQMVYVDVFPRFSHLRGKTGISPREDDMNVIQRLREALPGDVALWTEYPLTDVASQYADGCLQYYFIELNQTFARRYNRSDRADDLFMEMPLNIGRFALTRYRTFCLPGYIEASNKPNQMDAVFVNGEVFHEDTFRMQHSRLRAKVNRAYVVKHKYTDCFSSENPTPRVETAASGLTANLFPGTNRNLWTVFNGRPSTYSGVVLTVPHKPGMKYRDAWNGLPLTPVVEEGMALISLTLDPQQPGCVVQDWNR
ncbi:MAG: discoidin domain-containing protein, partial [Lentisphaeria bacterium]|nr:discoidin domain-containing protein [Lentisphaeria bacterium]